MEALTAAFTVGWKRSLPMRGGDSAVLEPVADGVFMRATRSVMPSRCRLPGEVVERVEPALSTWVIALGVEHERVRGGAARRAAPRARAPLT